MSETEMITVQQVDELRGMVEESSIIMGRPRQILAEMLRRISATMTVYEEDYK